MGSDTFPTFERTLLLFNYLSAAAYTHKPLRGAQSADGSVCKEHQSAVQMSAVVHFAGNCF